MLKAILICFSVFILSVAALRFHLKVFGEIERHNCTVLPDINYRRSLIGFEVVVACSGRHLDGNSIDEGASLGSYLTVEVLPWQLDLLEEASEDQGAGLDLRLQRRANGTLKVLALGNF